MSDCGCRHEAEKPEQRRILWIALALNAAMAVVGGIGGWIAQSTGLLADALDMPLRERNALLLAAGYAPTHPESALGTPDLAPVRRAIDFHEGVEIDEPALKALIRAAIEFNLSKKKKPAAKRAPAKRR